MMFITREMQGCQRGPAATSGSQAKPPVTAAPDLDTDQGPLLDVLPRIVVLLAVSLVAMTV
jgi:hypothetical protein